MHSLIEGESARKTVGNGAASLNRKFVGQITLRWACVEFQPSHRRGKGISYQAESAVAKAAGFINRRPAAEVALRGRTERPRYTRPTSPAAPVRLWNKTDMEPPASTG